MKKNLVGIIVIVAAVVGGGAFYAGMAYAKKAVTAGVNAQALSEERQQRFRGGRGSQGGQFTAGEIIEKDSQSITVKLRAGGSKIILLAPDTEVGKFVGGTAEDLIAGKTIMATGKANQDGSITAQSIQIRPMPPTTPAETQSKNPSQ